MNTIVDIMSTENPVFRAYIFYCAVLVLKMLCMAPLTAKQRLTKKVFANPEDSKGMKGSKIQFDDPDVERVRRAHLNDLENITLFFVIGYLYMLTNPAPFLAINLFRAFTGARILHTLVYAVIVLPQPARGIAWGVGYLITGYMALQTAVAFIL